MEETTKNRNKIVELILGILFIIIGIYSFTRPVQAIIFLIFWFGILAIIRGIADIFGFSKYDESVGKGIRIFSGILDIIIGYLFISNVALGIFWITILFSFWILMESISNLFLDSRLSKQNGIAKIGLLILDVLCFIIAIAMLFNPVVVIVTLPVILGTFAVLFGVIQVIHSFVD